MDASSLSSPCFVGEKIEEDVNDDDKENSSSVKFDIDDIPDLPFGGRKDIDVDSCTFRAMA